MLPALSVVTTRRSYRPSVCAVVSSWRPGSSSCRRRWRALELDGATPAPPASAELLVSATAADRGGVGRERDVACRERLVDPDLHRGGRRLGVSGRVGREDTQVVETVAEPSRVERGGVRRRASIEMSVHVPAPAGERWKVTVLTVPGAVSEAIALSATLVPRRFAPAAGTVTEPVGRVRSTVVRTSSVVWRPALSVARTRRSRVPSAGIAQETPYGNWCRRRATSRCRRRRSRRSRPCTARS